VIVFVVSFVLIGASNVLTRHEKPEGKARKRFTGKTETKALDKPKPHDSLIDDEMAEIQAILKKRGIS
jgi:hypothetical protein